MHLIFVRICYTSCYAYTIVSLQAYTNIYTTYVIYNIYSGCSAIDFIYSISKKVV